MINFDGDGKVHMTLLDFNVAKRFLDTETGNPLLMMTNTGTAKYQAPETLVGNKNSYDERIDLWSSGALLYYLLTSGLHAFDFIRQEEVEAAIIKGAYNKECPEYQKISDEQKDLIQGLLTVDYNKRLSV
jgi:serine/threonine protein kinase